MMSEQRVAANKGMFWEGQLCARRSGVPCSWEKKGSWCGGYVRWGDTVVLDSQAFHNTWLSYSLVLEFCSWQRR